MSARLKLGIAGVLSVAALVFAPAAPAATEVGSNCVADQTQPNSTLVQLYTRPGTALPIAAPTGGVLTQWKVNLGSVGSLPLQLKVLEPGGNPNDFHVVAQSPVIAGSVGQNIIESRLPVKPGYRFGLYSPDGQTPYCHTAFAQDVLGYALGDAQVTSTYTFPMESQAQVPVAARIEPDADNDGFGDETQDKCPQSAAIQSACPVVALSVDATAQNGFAKVLVTSNLQASVTVAGTVNVGKGKTMNLDGGAQAVAPGAFAKFRLVFPQKLKAKLKQLSRKRSLSLRLTATAANPVGPPTLSELKVKLKGQAKPKPRRQAKS